LRRFKAVPHWGTASIRCWLPRIVRISTARRERTPLEKPQDRKAGRALSGSVGTSAQEFHKSQIPQPLELLADFGFDVAGISARSGR